MEEELRPQPNQLGQGETRTSEPPMPVDTSAGAGQNVIEASLGIPITDVIPTGTPEYEAPSPNLDFSGDDEVDRCDPPPRGFRGRWLSRDRSWQDEAGEAEHFDDEVGGTPTVDWEADNIPANPEEPTGVVVEEKDAKVLANHTFLSNVKWSSISMPWESGFMKNIFGEDVLGLSTDLRQDASWIEAVTHVPVSTIAADSSNPSSSGPELKPAFVKCVKAIREQSFVEMRETEMKAAVTKWSLFLRSSLEHSVVGKQINSSPGEMLDIVRAAMGVKSPSTVLSRANSMLAFMRWHTLGPPNDEMLPLKEEAAWQYVSHLKESSASASKASSFVQACRFCHYVLGVEGALQVVSSRRVCGLADIQLSGKREAKQARPLTVKEAQDLHRVASCSTRHLVDRIVASHLLLMMYCRRRHSDTLAVEDVLHDHSEGAGYVQLRTKFHKGSKSAAKKSLLLPIVGSSAGVGSPSWVQSWWETRSLANLPVEGHLGAPLMPAPALHSDTQWSTRPLTSTEITAMLRSLLGVFDDTRLTSHSLKTTCLSWCAKADVSREHRRILGRHTSAVVDADSIYSRDLMYGPVVTLEKVMSAICEGRFNPDAPRSQYWPTAMPICRTPKPADFQGPGVVPMTPRVNIEHQTLAKQDAQPAPVVEPAAPVKKEDDWDLIPTGHDATEEAIEISSSSESESSVSEVSLSSDDEGCQVQEPHPKTARWQVKPASEEKWFQHSSSKVIHAAPVHDPEATMISICGRIMKLPFREVTEEMEWTYKCRICFAGRRQPVIT